jgi:hypothetical protein
MLAPAPRQRRFQLVLIKPSHYDADGYVIQWARSSIPSNSLAAVYALAMDAGGAAIKSTRHWRRWTTTRPRRWRCSRAAMAGG